MTRALSFRGDSIITTITADIISGDLSIPIAASTGWPSGAGGKPFVAMLIAADLSIHEKVLVASRSGLTLTVALRAWDDTIAAGFSSGATIMHVPDAASHQAFSDHLDDPDPVGHSTLLNPARHDLATRHQFGAALVRPSTMQPIGAAQSVGNTQTQADGAHVHALDPSLAGPGLQLLAGILGLLYDDATVTVSGDTLQVKAGGIGNAQMGSHAVQAGNIDPATVWPGTLADGSVDVASRIVDGIITRAKLATDARKSVDVAWGFIGLGVSTTEQLGVTSEVNLQGATVTFTAVAARRYKYTLFMPRMQQNSSLGEVQVKITDGANAPINAGSFASTVLSVNGTWAPVAVCYETGITPGSTTRKARVKTGAGNVDVNGATFPGFFLVEDIGPG